MTYTIRITDRAFEDLKTAAINYENYQQGLGQKFLQAFKETADWIQQNPTLYAIKFDGIRSVRIQQFKKKKRKRKFNQLALYEIFDKDIPIYALVGMSTKESDPENWGRFKR